MGYCSRGSSTQHLTARLLGPSGFPSAPCTRFKLLGVRHMVFRAVVSQSPASLAHPLVMFPISWEVVSCWLPLPSMRLQAFIKGILQKGSLLRSVLPVLLTTQAREQDYWQERVL